MEKISVFNYEAFYLDFLEGNLNEVDTVLFLEFLSANPDLKMEEDDLPIFSEESIALDLKTKENLKHHTEDELVVLANIEHFLIAQVEGIISPEKSKEVDSFVAANSVFSKEKALYNSAYFIADERIVFENKQSLKRKKAIVLWPYYAAAASLLLAMLVWYSNSNGKLEQQNLFADDTIEKNIQNTDSDTLVKEDVVLENNNDSKKMNGATENYSPKNNPIFNEENNISHLPIARNNSVENDNQTVIADNSPSPKKMKEIVKKKKSIIPSIENIELTLVSSNEQLMANSEVAKEENNDYASIYFSDVANPIEPMTSFVAKKTKTEVDFRRQKKTETKPSKIYLKIGKFEFSRKKH
ncbi:MAG TPA: hypothetical protein EYG86_04905 [Crocinitomicaceae bacterium]|nr:hypothetical protein [Crocinitomicaceae bacterium]